jgi:hypothetical protein
MDRLRLRRIVGGSLRRFGGIWLEVRLDVDDEGGTDAGEQSGLGTRSMMWAGNWSAETRENQGGVEVLIAFFHALGIALRCLSFVRGVEIELWVIAFDRFGGTYARPLGNCLE